MILIARLYLELRLPQASKSYALAVAYIAALKRDETLADLVPAGLLMAASADFIAGAWCSAAELYELGLAAQYEFVEDGGDWEKHNVVQSALLHLTYIDACARTVNSDLAALISSKVARTGAQDLIEDTINTVSFRDTDHWESFGTDVQSALLHLTYIDACARTVNSDLAALISSKVARTGAQDLIEDTINTVSFRDTDHWESFGTDELVGRPFADLGQVRYICFSALGTDWTLVVANDVWSVRLAERLAASAQVILAALAREDLCLVPTRINVRVENRQGIWTPSVEPIESLPSNDGREWVVRLEPAINKLHADSEEHVTELITILTMILREASLLPEADFSATLERAFGKGLGHKLSPGRPYDQLVAAFGEDIHPEIQESQYNTPWDSRGGLVGAHNELGWNDGKGPTYSEDRANELLQTRYQNLASGLRISV